MKGIFPILLILFAASAALAQREVLSNAEIIALTKAGLPQTVILNKIKSSEGRFDVSVNGLVEMKKAGVSDDVINALLESKPVPPSATDPIPATITAKRASPLYTDPREALLSAKTIAITKTSVQPSLHAVEKELMKRKEFQALNLSIDHYWDKADLYVEIGFVHMSLITHRYTFRIYDRRSGTVVAAGETTSWGSLAENLARNIAKSLEKVLSSPAQKTSD
jgi:hypothetical protein